MKVLSAALEVEYKEVEKPSDKIETGDATIFMPYAIFALSSACAYVTLRKKED